MNKVKESMIMRGIASAIQAMSMPTLNAINTMLNNSNYMLMDMTEFNFITGENIYNNYDEAYHAASMNIINENTDTKPEKLITITHK